MKIDDINLKIRDLMKAGHGTITVQNPRAKHSLGSAFSTASTCALKAAWATLAVALSMARTSASLAGSVGLVQKT